MASQKINLKELTKWPTAKASKSPNPSVCSQKQRPGLTKKTMLLLLCVAVSGCNNITCLATIQLTPGDLKAPTNPESTPSSLLGLMASKMNPEKYPAENALAADLKSQGNGLYVVSMKQACGTQTASSH